MKKVFFILVVIVLAWWAWYMNQKNTTTGSSESSLDRALRRMESRVALQSSVMWATQTPYSLEEIEDNEKAYQTEVAPRLTSMNALRDAKKSEIRTYLASSVSTANITLLLEKALAKEYVTEVNTLLNDSTKTDLYNLSSTIKDKIRQDTTLIWNYSDEVKAVLLFQQDWAVKRTTICTTDDSTNPPDIYKKWTVSFTYVPNTTKVDTCEGTGNAQKVRQFVCTGNQYKTPTADDPQTAKYEIVNDCPFGCDQWACKKGQLGAIELVDKATNGTVITSRQKGEEFWIRLSPQKDAANNNVKAEVSSPEWSFGTNKCTLATKSINVTTGWAPIIFGPIKCTSSSDTPYSFTVSLKTGTTVQETQTVSMKYNDIQLDRFNVSVTKADKIGVGTSVDITATAIGSTGLTYKDFTGEINFIVTGDEGVDYDRTAKKLNSNGIATLKGIKFSKAGTFKVLVAAVVSAEKTVTGEVDVVVKDAPTASIEWRVNWWDLQSGSLNVAFNDTLTLEWSGGSFSSATSSVVASPASCSKTWLSLSATSQSGSSTFTVPGSLPTGCKWTVKYTVKNALNQSDDSTIVINWPTAQ